MLCVTVGFNYTGTINVCDISGSQSDEYEVSASETSVNFYQTTQLHPIRLPSCNVFVSEHVNIPKTNEVRSQHP
jgi:hypothetical protein